MKIPFKKAKLNASHKNTNISVCETEVKKAKLNMSHKKRRGATGQLSIFILLVFPTLFMLFAMSLNIALVVHDKINLQNSVDIAAYYGAMKQAEMLNAIAHINYQIRQSWKLLTWRYRVLGSMGLTDVPSRGGGNNASWGIGLQWPPPDQDTEHQLPAYPPSDRYRSGGPYFFCVGHFDWGGLIGTDTHRLTNHNPENDLLCAKMTVGIPALHVPRVGGGNLMGLGGTFARITTATEGMNNALTRKCELYGFNSWLLGAISFARFKWDQSARKQMIKEIANALIEGRDIDNKPIQTGVKNTFRKNLSFINKSSNSSLVHFSSLAGINHAQPKQVTSLLEDQPFLLQGFYSNLVSPVSGDCNKEISNIANTPHLEAVGKYPDLETALQEIDPDWPNCSTFCPPSAGLKKNENLMVYYGVKAELDYQNQIFLPFKLSLKAKAFAKPFGGRIGPQKDVDTLLPPNDKTTKPHNTYYDFDKFYAPNYSRYPGDALGLRSRLTHSYWTRPVRNTHKNEKHITNYLKPSTPGDRDPMARLDRLSSSIPIAIGAETIIARKWEIAAVAPDLFDVTYFTILPYYQYDYFPRLAKPGGILANASSHLRGDLGTYCKQEPCNKASDFQGTSVLKQFINHPLAGTQIQSVWKELKTLPPPSPPLTQPAYKIANLDLLLTGWNPPKKKYQDLLNYSDIENTYFGKCQKWVHGIDNGSLMNQPQLTRKGKIANGCIFGGRTGYSVKMIHRDMLTSPSPPDGW